MSRPTFGWATGLLAVALFLLPPGRRRRAVVGLRLGRGPAILLTIVVFTGTTPWPLLIQPAAAEDCGCDCPPPEWPAAADVSYFHYDHIGSPLLITDGAGQVVEHIRYDPYGAVRGRYDSAGNSMVVGRCAPDGVGPRQAIALVDLSSISAPILELAGALSAPENAGTSTMRGHRSRTRTRPWRPTARTRPIR